MDPMNREEMDFVFGYLKMDPKMFRAINGKYMLAPDHRLDLYKPFIDYFNAHKVSYACADNDLRYFGNNRCCCGDALVHKATACDTTAMIRDYGYGWSLKDCLERYKALGIEKCLHHYMSDNNSAKDTELDYVRKAFNNRTNPASPNFQYKKPSKTFF